MKNIIKSIIWWFKDDTVYVHVCPKCGFIHYDDGHGLCCCICQNSTIKVAEKRAKSWRGQVLRENRIALMRRVEE